MSKDPEFQRLPTAAPVNLVGGPQARLGADIVELRRPTNEARSERQIVTLDAVLKEIALVKTWVEHLVAIQGDLRPRRHIRLPEGTDLWLTLIQVCEITGHSKAAIYAWVKAGTFPPPIKTSAKSSRWSRTAVSEWVERRKAVKP